RFGLSAADLAKVTSWLQSQGVTVDGVSRGRTEVLFSETAAQGETVLQSELHKYVLDGETHFANASEISVPAALSNMVLGFRGLDSFRPKPRARAVKPNFTSHVSGSQYVAPGDFASIYNVKQFYDAGFDGTG